MHKVPCRASTPPYLTDAVSGQYIGPDGPLGMRGAGAKPVLAMKKAYDEAVAKRLWDVSEQLTGVSYGPLDPAS